MTTAELLAEPAHPIGPFTAGAHRRGQRLRAESDEVGEAPGLGLLDVGKGGFAGPPLPAQAEAHQSLVDRELVLEERDLEVVRLEMAPQVLESRVGPLQRPVRAADISSGLLDLAQDRVGLDAQGIA